MIEHSTAQVRAFIAVELPAPVKSALKELQNSLSSASRAPVKWVNPENIHLTLKFLGNVPVDQIAPIAAAMKEATGDIHPFTLRLSGLGAFPSLRKVQVIWVGVGGALDFLQTLVGRLENDLEVLGFAREGRAFTPHLTLARVQEKAAFLEMQELGLSLGRQRFEGGQIIPVEAVNLMRSQLSREGPTYSCLESIRLK